MRLDPPINTRIKHRSPPELILCEIDIPIKPHTQCIRPPDARISREYIHSPVRWVEKDDRIILEIAPVNEAIRVGF